LHGSAPVGQIHIYVERFLSGLKVEGFEPERNLTVEYRWAEGEYDRMPGLAAEILKFRPSLELLRDLLPESGVFGLILNSNNSDSAEVTRAAEAGAAVLGRRLVTAPATTPEELDTAFASLAERHVDGLLMGSDTFLNAQSDRILSLAARHRLPTIYNGQQSAEAGGLLSYGADFGDNYRLMGSYAGKILKGAKPADLPVVEPTRFELVVNLRTAKALGLTVPPSILARADEVVE
jgi:putative ABC transport system substrate-binding protein